MDDVVGILLKAKNNGATKHEIADKIGASPSVVDDALNALRTEGSYLVERFKDHLSGQTRFQLSTTISPSEGKYALGPEWFPGGTRRLKFGAVTNISIGSKYHREDALNAYYRICERMKDVGVVFVLGDLLFGEESKKKKGEALVQGLEFQTEQLVMNYPRVNGIHTFFITSAHDNENEGSFMKRHRRDIGKYIEDMARNAGRQDLHYLGTNEKDVYLPLTWKETVNGKSVERKQDVVVRLAHLTTKIPYAASYPAQKMTESIQGGTKPHVILLGHTGNIEDMFPREIWTVQGGGFIDQTPSMRNDRRGTAVGGYVIELWHPHDNEEQFQDDQVAMNAESIPFFNRSFYEGNRAYHVKGRPRR